MVRSGGVWEVKVSSVTSLSPAPSLSRAEVFNQWFPVPLPSLVPAPPVGRAGRTPGFSGHSPATSLARCPSCSPGPASPPFRGIAANGTARLPDVSVRSTPCRCADIVLGFPRLRAHRLVPIRLSSGFLFLFSLLSFELPVSSFPPLPVLPAGPALLPRFSQMFLFGWCQSLINFLIFFFL